MLIFSGLGYRDPNKNVAPVLKSFGDDLKPGKSTDENVLKDKYSGMHLVSYKFFFTPVVLLSVGEKNRRIKSS